MADTIVKRVGGKSKMAGWIKKRLPRHKIYCEVFGGSFAVGFQMPNADGSNYRLVYNDLDRHVSNFFRVLRESPAELARRIDLTPYSRGDFEQACDFINSKQDFSVIDPIEWARNYLIFNRQSIFGKETGNWCVSRHGENICMTWANLPPLITELGKRLKEIYIECDDYRNVLKRWDSEETCHYIDPPYLDVEKDFYHVNKEDGFDHIEMANQAKVLKGSWAISYYDSPEIRELYSGYEFHTLDVKKHMQTEKKKSQVVEVLIVSRNSWSIKNDEPQCFPAE